LLTKKILFESGNNGGNYFMDNYVTEYSSNFPTHLLSVPELDGALDDRVVIHHGEALFPH
jgi:hypothetical protein